jgi:hypothetical protein
MRNHATHQSLFPFFSNTFCLFFFLFALSTFSIVLLFSRKSIVLDADFVSFLSASFASLFYPSGFSVCVDIDILISIFMSTFCSCRPFFFFFVAVSSGERGVYILGSQLRRCIASLFSLNCTPAALLYTVKHCLLTVVNSKNASIAFS